MKANKINNISWMITSKKVEQVIRKIIEISNPSKLIIFGSYAKGKINLNSDLDVLVVVNNSIENPRKESVRIRRALKGILLSIDIIVIPESKFTELANTPGLIYREAIRTGKVVYESAA
ncbi:MAG: nucleotidyltransferase domain-containing protein [Candidatus Schekmanbacteria bacterium]|nr:nucleotidyltransferase domain-containing protein [Candidatus Schekmanbacteria bacterium]